MKRIRRKRIDLTGQRYGRLTVVGFAGRDNNGNQIWRVRCDCGTEFEAYAGNLRNGVTRSCGCYRNEVCASRAEKMHEAWRIPVIVIIGDERHKCESISMAAKLIGCSFSSARTATFSGKPFKGFRVIKDVK